MILDDDDERTPDVGSWAEQKYALLENYCEMFATAMKDKWDSRVCVDLFAGPGRARIRGTSKILPGSPTIALGVRNPFDRYVFVDADQRNVSALEQRVQRDHATRDVVYLCGDANEVGPEVVRAMTRGLDRNRMLAFCLLDPFAIENLKFSTVERLAQVKVDFLVLIPSEMDANRNQARLLKADYPLLDRFLGRQDWRDEWLRVSSDSNPGSFGAFVVDQFGRSMESIGYIYERGRAAVPIKRDDGRILYYLALYSRHPLGAKFWRQAVAYQGPQIPLFDE